MLWRFQCNCNFQFGNRRLKRTAWKPVWTSYEYRDGIASRRQRLKWFVKRGGAHLTTPSWSKPHTHSNPTNLALFRHKMTLYRFNHTIAGGSNWSRGLVYCPPHFSHCTQVSETWIWPSIGLLTVCVSCSQSAVPITANTCAYIVTTTVFAVSFDFTGRFVVDQWALLYKSRDTTIRAVMAARDVITT